MIRTIKSYLCGEWVEGSGEGIPLVDPTTEEVLALSSIGGLDLAAALDFARGRGGPALRAMSFAERGALLKRASRVLFEHRDELLGLSVQNGGNTRSDAKFDVDGATYTLSYYAKLGQTLGDEAFLIDGELEQLGKSPRFVGGHLLVPLTGAAIHINAFNFPAWGFAEKAAVALLAGVPVVTKPAPATALLTERMVEILVDERILPPGALTLISGPPGDLLEHVRAHDVVAFTGSAQTGAVVRSHAGLVQRAVRVNVEADSINAAVLGPDVDPNAETYGLFLNDVAREITQRAGQKCTAIRRILIPADRLDPVSRDLAEALSRVTVGDPSLREVDMGPVVTSEQLARVRGGIERLLTVTEAVVGDGGRGKPVGVDGDDGFFMAPVLLRADDARSASMVHDEEVFGPVSTALGYSGEVSDAVDIVALGGGSLVTSIYSDDRDFALPTAVGVAPHSGRVYLGSEKIAGQAAGPGAVLPGLVHGGPGRAGAGQELGGIRALPLYMQRTAIQGDRPVLERGLGWSR